MKKILYIVAALGLMFSSCSKENDFENPNSGDGAVQFMASAPTRVTENSEWQADDRIGVFAGSVSNTEYKIKADNSGAMEYVSGTAIYAPSSSQSYYGYYPYDADINGSKLSVDLTSNQLPLVWAEAENMSGSNVTFDFKHQLVKLNLTFRAGGLDIANLDGATATLKGANTKGEFDVVTGAWNNSATVAEDLPLTIATTEKSITLTSYVMPTNSPNTNATIEISAGSKNFVWQPTTTAWEVGNTYDYNVTVGAILDIALVEGVYQIYSAKGMKAFADLVNGNSNSSNAITAGDGFATFGTANTDINGQLMCDIDLSYICSKELGDWSPIGDEISTRYYAGEFDGGNYTVSGLYIHNDNAGGNKGLFGSARGAVIKNLTVSGSVVTPGTAIAGIVGFAYSNTTIVNCRNHVEVTVVSDNVYFSDYIGGVVGLANSSIIINCSNEAPIVGTQYVGGVAGQITAGDNNFYVSYTNAAIVNCYNTAKVTGAAQVGGITGAALRAVPSGDDELYKNLKAYVTNCYNVGAVVIDRQRTPEYAEVGDFIGGIVGQSVVDQSEVSNCYWLAATGTDATHSIGAALSDPRPSTSDDAVTLNIDMQSESFVTELNTNATNYNNATKPINDTPNACTWNWVPSGFPQHHWDYL